MKRSRSKSQRKESTASASKRPSKFALSVAEGLKAAAEEAKRVARIHGTPVYTSDGGRGVVARCPWEGIAAWIVFIPSTRMYCGGFFGDRGQEWSSRDIEEVRSQLRKHVEKVHRTEQRDPTERFVELIHFTR